MDMNYREGIWEGGGVQDGVWGRKGEEIQGIRSINGRYKIDRGRVRICLLYTSDAADELMRV